MFPLKYGLDRSTKSAKYDSTGVQTHDLQIIFHVTETPAWPSVTIII